MATMVHNAARWWLEAGRDGDQVNGGYLYVKVANERKIPTYSYATVYCTWLHDSFPGLFSRRMQFES
jgi:hypothetical protein